MELNGTLFLRTRRIISSFVYSIFKGKPFRLPSTKFLSRFVSAELSLSAWFYPCCASHGTVIGNLGHVTSPFEIIYSELVFMRSRVLPTNGMRCAKFWQIENVVLHAKYLAYFSP